MNFKIISEQLFLQNDALMRYNEGDKLREGQEIEKKKFNI